MGVEASLGLEVRRIRPLSFEFQFSLRLRIGSLGVESRGCLSDFVVANFRVGEAIIGCWNTFISKQGAKISVAARSSNA